MKLSVAILLAFVAFCLTAQSTFAQFYSYTRAIPQSDTNGVLVVGANTFFADGTFLQPAGDDSRSSKWAWRPYGDVQILSSLGPSTSTPPTNTKELVTIVCGLKPSSPYAVKILFWSTTTGLWGIRGGLCDDQGLRTNAWFNNTISNCVVPANLLAWSSTPSIFSESGRTLYAAAVGTATTSPAGQLKVYVHDLPATDSNLRTWYQGIAVLDQSDHGPYVLDVDQTGTPIAPGVRGLALADCSIDRGEYVTGIPKSLIVARGSSIRGVATGLAADLYDWRVRNSQARPPTLEFLRYSRDYDALLFLGANIRGLVSPNPGGGFVYTDTTTNTLATVAADWVRYVNHIVATYRQGDSITNARDSAILDSLTWNSTFPGDSFDKLLAPAEPPVPKIVYWEIGNEPTVNVTSFSVSNSYTMNGTEYHDRYGPVAKAIKAEDPTVKVGPTLVNGSREADQLAAIVSDPSLPIDFVTYHPYEKMGLLDDPTLITLHLGSIFSRQSAFLTDIKNVIAANGRDPQSIEYAATEVNVSNWDTNDTDKEARMAHALGTVETVFSHARLGLVVSHYWIWPSHRWDGTEYPVYKAYEKLRDHMGDTLVSTYFANDLRVYTTRDRRTGKIAIWMLNFSNNDNKTVQLQPTNLPEVSTKTLYRLADTAGVTTLFSANLSTDMPGGPTSHVAWTSTDLSQQDITTVTIPAATLSVLVIEPAIGHITPGIIEDADSKRFCVSFTAIRHASTIGYRLLESTDLVNWLPSAQIGPITNATATLSAPLTTTPGTRFFKVERVDD